MNQNISQVSNAAATQAALNRQLASGETVLWSTIPQKSPLLQFIVWILGNVVWFLMFGFGMFILSDLMALAGRLVLAALIATIATVVVVRVALAKTTGMFVYALTNQRLLLLFAGTQDSAGYAVPLTALRGVSTTASPGAAEGTLTFDMDRSAVQFIGMQATAVLPVDRWGGIPNPHDLVQLIDNARRRADTW